jgi:hypothetical protein
LYIAPLLSADRACVDKEKPNAATVTIAPSEKQVFDKVRMPSAS